MTMTRREWLESMGIAALGASIPFVGACNDTTAPALPSYQFTGTPGPATMFELGVASGDSLSDAVIFWTHVSPGATGPVDVWLDVATDADFRHRVVAQSFACDDTTDYTLKVDVGELAAGTTHYYRFFALGVQSPVGRTKTLPTGNVSQLRFGVVSCANYGFGYFHAYRRLAERADLDAVIHLGDYIYEFGNGFYPFSSQRIRDTAPLMEIITLANYRERYRHYHGDPDLQEGHRQHPWFTIWDDHEVANDSNMSGAQGHDPGSEGTYTDRLAAAKQAYFEYLPIRGTPASGVYRTARFGNLADVVFLDTRLVGRSPQISDLTMDDATRSVLGATQETWLDQQLANSTTTWRIIAQQVPVAQYTYDAVSHTPVFLDQWDGYPLARGRFFDSIEANGGGNVVVLTGDLHGSAVFELTPDPWDTLAYDPATGSGALAVEFIGTSVTSPYLAFGDVTTEPGSLAAASPHLKWADLNSHGFMIVDVNGTRVQTDYFVVDGVGPGSVGTATFEKGFIVSDGVAHAVEAASESPAKAIAAALAP